MIFEVFQCYSKSILIKAIKVIMIIIILMILMILIIILILIMIIIIIMTVVIIIIIIIIINHIYIGGLVQQNGLAAISQGHVHLKTPTSYYLQFENYFTGVKFK